MKRKIRLTAMAAALVMLLAAAMPVYADTIIDYVLYTDIRTYIGGVEISSYNINGYTAVVVEDLANYGFDVVWNGSARTLTAKRAVGKAVTGSAVSSTSGGKVGDRAMPVYATDIKTYFDGVEFKSYNVGGKTIVYVDDLANKYASDYKWNQTAKTLSMSFSGTVAPAQVSKPINLFDTTALYDGNAYKIYNPEKTQNFKLGSKTYFEGFTLRGSNYSSDNWFVLFDFNNSYSKFTFDVGWCGDTKQNAILKVFIEGKLSEQIELSYEKPSTSITIDIRNISGMRLQIVPSKKYDYVTYGFANCLLYP